MMRNPPKNRLNHARKSGEPHERDASGTKLRTAADDFRRFEVARVLEPGPAAEAGVRAGDLDFAIGGKPASQ